jgi:hypothetical protein
MIRRPTSPRYLAETEVAAPSLGVMSGAPVHNAAEIEAVIDTLAREPNGGLIVSRPQPLAFIVTRSSRL